MPAFVVLGVGAAEFQCFVTDVVWHSVGTAARRGCSSQPGLQVVLQAGPAPFSATTNPVQNQSGC